MDDRLEVDTGEQRILERRSQDRKQRYNLGAISPRKAEEMQIEALKEAYEELKESRRRREYHFRSDPRRQRPICIVIVPLTAGESIGERRIVNKNRQDAREIFEAMQERGASR